MILNLRVLCGLFSLCILICFNNEIDAQSEKQVPLYENGIENGPTLHLHLTE